MTPEGETWGNGWVRRATALAEIVATPAGMFAVFLLLYVVTAKGLLPFAPIDRLVASSDKNNAAVLEAIHGRASQEAALQSTVTELAATIKILSLTLTRMDRRAQIIDCSSLKDSDLRRRCLE